MEADAIRGFEDLSQGQGGRGAIGGEAREGVEHLSDEEGEGDCPLWLHPPRYLHQQELGAQPPNLSAPLPGLITILQWEFFCEMITLNVINASIISRIITSDRCNIIVCASPSRETEFFF